MLALCHPTSSGVYTIGVIVIQLIFQLHSATRRSHLSSANLARVRRADVAVGVAALFHDHRADVSAGGAKWIRTPDPLHAIETPPSIVQGKRPWLTCRDRPSTSALIPPGTSRL
jgi:hypothetical protein